MKRLNRISVVLLILMLGACAHPINITPKALEVQGNPVSAKNVAYLISQSDRDLEVTTDGGGGDKVRYFPYRDLESGIFQVLSSIFPRVTLIRALGDDAALSKNDVSLIMIPRITTTSSSDGLLTWPPTQFSVVIDYRFQDRTGKETYKNIVMGDGRATFAEFSAAGDFSLAGRRASSDALAKLRGQIANEATIK